MNELNKVVFLNVIVNEVKQPRFLLLLIRLQSLF